MTQTINLKTKLAEGESNNLSFEDISAVPARLKTGYSGEPALSPLLLAAIFAYSLPALMAVFIVSSILDGQYK